MHTVGKSPMFVTNVTINSLNLVTLGNTWEHTHHRNLQVKNMRTHSWFTVNNPGKIIQQTVTQRLLCSGGHHSSIVTTVTSLKTCLTNCLANILILICVILKLPVIILYYSLLKIYHECTDMLKLFSVFQVLFIGKRENSVRDIIDSIYHHQDILDHHLYHPQLEREQKICQADRTVILLPLSKCS